MNLPSCSGQDLGRRRGAGEELTREAAAPHTSQPYGRSAGPGRSRARECRPSARPRGSDAVTRARSPSREGNAAGEGRGASRGARTGGARRWFGGTHAYPLRKSLSWRFNISCSSAKLRCPKSSGAGGSKPRGGKDILRGLRLGRRRALGFLGSAGGWRQIRGRRGLRGSRGSRHFPGRTGLSGAESNFIETPEPKHRQGEGAPGGAGRGGSYGGWHCAPAGRSLAGFGTSSVDSKSFCLVPLWPRQ